MRSAEPKKPEPTNRSSQPEPEKQAAPETPGTLWHTLALRTARGPAAAGADEPVQHVAGGPRIQRLRGSSEGGPFGTMEDGENAGAGQISRSAFLARALPLVERVAGEELARVGRSTRDCPYLAWYTHYYRTQSAAHIERVLARYTRPGAGRPLDPATRARMERGFGEDFSDVRIHADAHAAHDFALANRAARRQACSVSTLSGSSLARAIATISSSLLNPATSSFRIFSFASTCPRCARRLR